MLSADRFIEDSQFACQYFDKLNMTIKLTFETAFDYSSLTLLNSSRLSALGVKPFTSG